MAGFKFGFPDCVVTYEYRGDHAYIVGSRPRLAEDPPFVPTPGTWTERGGTHHFIPAATDSTSQ